MANSDRELLEAAARAAGMGLIVFRNATTQWATIDGGFDWNPLLDNGQCARLEAALGLPVRWWGNCVTVNNGIHGDGATEFFADHGGDKNAARRRASVRAAAAIAPTGETKEG